MSGVATIVVNPTHPELAELKAQGARLHVTVATSPVVPRGVCVVVDCTGRTEHQVPGGTT